MMIEFIDMLGYAFIAAVIFALGYVFVRIFAAGLDSLLENDD